MDSDDIRRVFLANGFTIKDGHTDLKPYVYAAARALLALSAPPAAQVAAAGWRPIETAPKDGTLLLLLVEFEDHATEDTPEPSPTIGANSLRNTGEDEWKFAGWCWTHDEFTAGVGKPVAWMPIPLAATPSAPAGAGNA